MMSEKVKGLPEFIEIEKDDDSDTPMEASSKMQNKLSDAASDSFSKNKKKLRMKRKRKNKREVIKVDEGVYQSETKTSTIKIVPLSVSPPPPTYNFRDKLLQKRTKDQRLKKTEHAGLQHRVKWFRATKPGKQ